AFTVPASLLIACSLLCVAIFGVFGLYRTVFRFISRIALFKAGLAVVASAACLSLVNFAFMSRPVSAYALIIFGGFALLYVAMSRSLVREVLYFRRGKKERVLIYGAGEAGAQLVRSLRDGRQCEPLAFIDCDRALQGRVIAG